MKCNIDEHNNTITYQIKMIYDQQAINSRISISILLPYQNIWFLTINIIKKKPQIHGKCQIKNESYYQLVYFSYFDQRIYLIFKCIYQLNKLIQKNQSEKENIENKKKVYQNLGLIMKIVNQMNFMALINKLILLPNQQEEQKNNAEKDGIII
ncbi:unnamed protein product [Paramecium primaurelia]|uniref:Uncharacterized protein n=1 Tax=Paramecium primaurelia TaxID=5886 RepID=A0A8S1JQI6_PARPR|nr:unnamed protein product [Paramecium primaurelia]